VAATRLPEETFWSASYLGRSLSHIPKALRPKLNITFDNDGISSPVQGLSTIYNAAIENSGDDEVLLLVHDDVYIHDWFIRERLDEALGSWDVVGLAGSVNPDLSEPSWGLAFDQSLNSVGWQEGLQRSGAVSHLNYDHPDLSVYGPTPLQCKLMDGLFLAFNGEQLREEGIRFDETFDFHLYDLDFCRTASAKGLTLGTWPIAVTHSSRGSFDTEDFKRSARRYLDKWAD
jgi:GT2 family glycosyltransferase